jgi:hypothetical protein
VKIAAIIATRGRPHQAVGVIESMRLLATGDNELEFIVACDEDDQDTRSFLISYDTECWDMRGGIEIDCRPRPSGVAACWNRCISLTDAEAIITLPDDGIFGTPRWDHCINWAWRNHDWVHPELKIAAVRDLANPGQPTLFVVGRDWIKHCGLFDERYPFWFSDTAIAETYSFITGQGMPMLPIDFASCAFKFNPRLRDMRLWWAHYAKTRYERLDLAEQVCEQLGMTNPRNLTAIVAGWQARDAKGLPDSEEIVRQIEKPAPVDERYLAAKAAAEAYLGV